MGIKPIGMAANLSAQRQIQDIDAGLEAYSSAHWSEYSLPAGDKWKGI
jgi:hypothetical protein